MHLHILQHQHILERRQMFTQHAASTHLVTSTDAYTTCCINISRPLMLALTLPPPSIMPHQHISSPNPNRKPSTTSNRNIHDAWHAEQEGSTEASNKGITLDLNPNPNYRHDHKTTLQTNTSARVRVRTRNRCTMKKHVSISTIAQIAKISRNLDRPGDIIRPSNLDI